MGPIGIQEMIGICLIALILFGPKKLPELGRTLGKALAEFRRAKNDLKSTFESHLQELERETRFNEPQKSFPPSTSYSSVSYPYPYDENGGYIPPSEQEPQTVSLTPELPAIAESSVPDTAEVHHVPMVDTVPRLNGVQPIGARAEQEPPASA